MNFNYNSLLIATGDDQELARQLILTLKSQIPETLAELEKAIDTGNIIVLQRIAHTLRSPLGTIGAESILKLAVQLEAIAAIGDSNTVSTVANDLCTDLKVLRDELVVPFGDPSI